MIFYNFRSRPGMVLGYNAPISCDWEASPGNAWTVPLGLTVGKTLDMGNGNGLDISGGPYYNVSTPDGGAKWQIRFGLTWLFP